MLTISYFLPGSQFTNLQDSLLDGNIKAEEQKTAAAEKFIMNNEEESIHGATIVSDSSQDEVSPAKIIDTALTKIENEASKLIKESKSNVHGSGSGVEEEDFSQAKFYGGGESNNGLSEKSPDSSDISSFAKEDKNKDFKEAAENSPDVS